jgi:hypothetical protein
MLRIALVAAALIAAASALALDEPVTWRDPDTQCAYWLLPNGGMTPRLRRNGTPDCPGARITIDGPVAVMDETEVRDATVRDLTQAVQRLQREVEAIRREIERRR